MARKRSLARLMEPGLSHSEEALSQLRSLARPLADDHDLDPLLERVGDSRFVLLGESSHGTSEFYSWRARLSRRLIEEKGFSFLAVEGDWPDFERINGFVKEHGAEEDVREVLKTLHRWPTWMWANEEVADMAGWLRQRNSGLPEAQRVGWYGLDVYSLWESMEAVVRYLERVDPEAARRARGAYECFAPYEGEAEQYAYATALVPTTCEDEVVKALTEVRKKTPRGDGVRRERHFFAEQHALVARNAERYYRAMVQRGASSWNVRDEHMADTLDRLMAFHGPEAKAIVWAHNTHIGDARYTDMIDAGEFNLGQLVRQRHADEGVVLVGLSTYEGSVIAGDEWGAPMSEMKVPAGRPDSVEDLLHRVGQGDGLYVFHSEGFDEALFAPRGHRAIGVVYRPEVEHYGNYVPTVLPRRYDALLFVDRSHALRPIKVSVHEERDTAETFPSGV